MALSTLLLSVLLCQDPAATTPAQDPSPTQRLDLVELKSGELLEGRIVTELGTYLEIELSPGARVGFSKAQIEKVMHGQGRAVDQPPPAANNKRDDWFVLHDAAGVAVGWLHATCTPTENGDVRLAEEWEFVQGNRRVSVTALEIGGSGLQPKTCYWRERILDDGSVTVREESIIEANVAGDDLVVQRTSLSGRSERRLPFPAQASFPLLAQQRLRLAPLANDNELMTLDVFDPATGELATRAFERGRKRQVELGGKAIEVIEVATRRGTIRNTEWLDASQRALRREINGPALVATPSTEAEARANAQKGAQAASALVVEAGRTFGIWLPNPAWAAVEGTSPRHLAARCAVRGAGIDVVVLDHLSDELSLESAADAVQRWCALLLPQCKFGERQAVRVRERAAVRLQADSAVVPTERVQLHVLAFRGQYLAILFRAPAVHWDELLADFDFVLRSVELDAANLSTLNASPKPASATRGLRPEAATATGSTPVDLPRVRVPVGQ